MVEVSTSLLLLGSSCCRERKSETSEPGILADQLGQCGRPTASSRLHEQAYILRSN